MSLHALLHLRYAQHVSGTSMHIIRSSRLYVCYCRLWCAMLGCWLLEVRFRAAGCESRRGMLHDGVVKHPSSWTHSLLSCMGLNGWIPVGGQVDPSSLGLTHKATLNFLCCYV